MINNVWNSLENLLDALCGKMLFMKSTYSYSLKLNMLFHHAMRSNLITNFKRSFYTVTKCDPCLYTNSPLQVLRIGRKATVFYSENTLELLAAVRTMIAS